MDLKTYLVRGIDINHDGKLYKEGEHIELGDADYAAKRRWLTPAAPPTRPAEPKPAKAGKVDEKKQADSGQPEEPDAGKTDGAGQPNESDAGKTDGAGKDKGGKQ